MRGIIIDEDRLLRLTELQDRYEVSRSYLVRRAIDLLYETLTRPAAQTPIERAV